MTSNTLEANLRAATVAGYALNYGDRLAVGYFVDAVRCHLAAPTYNTRRDVERTHDTIDSSLVNDESINGSDHNALVILLRGIADEVLR